ncbi:hypothetical protein MasN3_41290 [Massilia varians]|uniref:UDP-N-acetylenolpyruvoylglucosamine reductase n=1 Tax=Massilia varians TaxID=457921 RepID=A0ABM8CBF8_9BURK|nr:FAD-binding protein [Massilia varians]BDT60635.1 hypothetical protein MasN3_41290 [Massilia varians]
MNSMEVANAVLTAKSFLDVNQIWYKEDFVIRHHTCFKSGGEIKLYICPKNIEGLKLAVVEIRRLGLDYKLIGFTSNIFFLDKVTYSVVISTENLNKVVEAADVIQVEAGYSLQELVRLAVQRQSVGYEGLEGIPGSVGGAIFMNAGAYGYDIADVLISVDCLDSEGQIQTFTKEQCDFAYRRSVFQNGMFIILRAKFKLKSGDPAVIAKNVEMYHIARHSYQEFVYPNLGSIYSVNRDFYREIFKRSLSYTIVCILLKFFFKNPASKFVARKRPNNSIFNRLAVKYLKFRDYKPSKKSLNILINDGQLANVKLIRYLTVLRQNLASIPIENEVILEPIYSIAPEYKDEYDEIVALVEKLKKVTSS